MSSLDRREIQDKQDPKDHQAKGVSGFYYRYTPMFNYCFTDLTMLKIFRDPGLDVRYTRPAGWLTAMPDRNAL